MVAALVAIPLTLPRINHILVLAIQAEITQPVVVVRVLRLAGVLFMETAHTAGLFSRHAAAGRSLKTHFETNANRIARLDNLVSGLHVSAQRNGSTDVGNDVVADKHVVVVIHW